MQKPCSPLTSGYQLDRYFNGREKKEANAIYWAGGTDDFGCSNATLKGKYAFGVINYTGPTVVAGIRVYDGKGHFTQRDYMGDSVPAEFSPPGRETGTYTVNADCTGSDELDLNVPVPSGSTGVVKVLFVISNGGRHVHEVVSEFTPPDLLPDRCPPKRVPTSGRSRRSGTI